MLPGKEHLKHHPSFSALRTGFGDRRVGLGKMNKGSRIVR
jgi:hypothetical protein